MTYERQYIVEDPAIPKGYKVTHHEIRGYDSPDKWYEARDPQGIRIGSYATQRRAIEACIHEILGRS